MDNKERLTTEVLEIASNLRESVFLAKFNLGKLYIKLTQGLDNYTARSNAQAARDIHEIYGDFKAHTGISISKDKLADYARAYEQLNEEGGLSGGGITIPAFLLEAIALTELEFETVKAALDSEVIDYKLLQSKARKASYGHSEEARKELLDIIANRTAEPVKPEDKGEPEEEEDNGGGGAEPASLVTLEDLRKEREEVAARLAELDKLIAEKEAANV